MVIQRIVMAGAVALALAAGNVLAAPEGLFLGLGAGQSTMKAKSDNNIGPRVDLDESDTSYKGYAGWNFTNWFGIEGGYVELGNQDQSESVLLPQIGSPDEVKVEVSANGWQGFAVLYLPLGNFDLFAKVGGIAANIDVETKLHFPLTGTQHNKSSEGNGMMAYGVGAAYNFGHWSVRAEYEAYDVDKLDDLYNVTGSLQYNFFHEKEKPMPPPAPMPAAAPKPVAAAPVAPAKCPDADNDGVCDAADACPTTPPGARVDAIGCDCDFVLRTHFAFNSADLTAEDKTQLDTLATTLMNPKLHFVTGEVDGHTDNVGDPAYNMGLSKRRAEAVVAYMKAKGVAMGDRLLVQGFGQTEPIADNSTADGRAQNRRVSIHRTDCAPGPK